MDHVLSPSERTTVRRGSARARTDVAELDALLDEALIGYLGVALPDHPIVLPVTFAIDRDGPDPGGSVYIHGSPGAGWLRAAVGTSVCLTVAELDGLVSARAAMHQSMNYRSAVIIGTARRVTDEDEKARALDLIVDHMIPGHAQYVRPANGKENTRTAVVALPLLEASMKVRSGDPVDDEEDLDGPAWAGVIGLRRVACAPTTADDNARTVPDHVWARALALGAEPPSDPTC